MLLGAQFLYMALAMKQITVGLCASKLGTDVSILINPVPAFLARTEFHHHLVLSAKNVWCADCSIFITGCVYYVRCETFKYFIFSCFFFFSQMKNNTGSRKTSQFQIEIMNKRNGLWTK